MEIDLRNLTTYIRDVHFCTDFSFDFSKIFGSCEPISLFLIAFLDRFSSGIVFGMKDQGSQG